MAKYFFSACVVLSMMLCAFSIVNAEDQHQLFHKKIENNIGGGPPWIIGR